MRLNDKIQFVANGETITCTATFCCVENRKKPGIFWVDQDFCYWEKNDIPEEHTVIQKGNQTKASLLYKPKEISLGEKDWMQKMKGNWKMLEQIDEAQKKKGDILYRYVSFPYADGQSVYQITKLTNTAATLSLVTGIGDDWDAFGDGVVMDLESVLDNIKRRDQIQELFNRS